MMIWTNRRNDTSIQFCLITMQFWNHFTYSLFSVLYIVFHLTPVVNVTLSGDVFSYRFFCIALIFDNKFRFINSVQNHNTGCTHTHTHLPAVVFVGCVEYGTLFVVRWMRTKLQNVTSMFSTNLHCHCLIALIDQ